MQVEGGAGPLLDEAERFEGEPGVLILPVDGDDRLAVLIAPAAAVGGGFTPLLFALWKTWRHLLMEGLARRMSR